MGSCVVVSWLASPQYAAATQSVEREESLKDKVNHELNGRVMFVLNRYKLDWADKQTDRF